MPGANTSTKEYVLHFSIRKQKQNLLMEIGFIIQGVFFLTGPPPFSVPKRQMAFSQPELLLHDILHLRKPLVGSLAYFLFSTEWGGGAVKKHPVESKAKHRQTKKGVQKIYCTDMHCAVKSNS